MPARRRVSALAGLMAALLVPIAVSQGAPAFTNSPFTSLAAPRAKVAAARVSGARFCALSCALVPVQRFLKADIASISTHEVDSGAKSSLSTTGIHSRAPC